METDLAARALVLTMSAASLTFSNITIVTSADIDLAHVSNLVISLVTRLTNVALMCGTSCTGDRCTTWALANGLLALIATEVETSIADGTFEQTVLGAIRTLHGSATFARTDVGSASFAFWVVASAATLTIFFAMEGAECTVMWCARATGAYVLFARHALHAIAGIALAAELISMHRTRCVGSAT